MRSLIRVLAVTLPRGFDFRLGDPLVVCFPSILALSSPPCAGHMYFRLSTRSTWLSCKDPPNSRTGATFPKGDTDEREDRGRDQAQDRPAQVGAGPVDHPRQDDGGRC